jgi:3-deoxy-D-manno-octulosonic-acid transferase
LLLYNLGVRLYFFLIYIASFFNKKAKLWINGRKNTVYQEFPKSAWFHFASLGEYEQGLPVLSSYKASNPDLKIVITFFSPLVLRSGKIPHLPMLCITCRWILLKTRESLSMQSIHQ